MDIALAALVEKALPNSKSLYNIPDWEMHKERMAFNISCYVEVWCFSFRVLDASIICNEIFMSVQFEGECAKKCSYFQCHILNALGNQVFKSNDFFVYVMTESKGFTFECSNTFFFYSRCYLSIVKSSLL